MNIKDAIGRLARWSLLLQQHDFDIVHRPGKIHGYADSLSGCPFDTCDLSSLQNEDSQVARIREMQRRDPDLSQMIDFIESDVLPIDDHCAGKFC